MRRRWIAGILAGATLLGGGLVAAQVFGLATIESHRGYFAPVWDTDGQRVYFLQRDTFGITWGAGWEHFTGPANAYVISDRFSLRRLDPANGKTETLQDWSGGPLQGRITKHYRNRIFNAVSARVEPRSDGVQFTVRMSVYRIPRSTQWALKGDWIAGRQSDARWAEQWAGSLAAPDQVLVNGVELTTARGRAAFPAAILAIDAAGAVRVLAKNDDFDGLYPDGVPPKMLAERSRRTRIERMRALNKVQNELLTRYRAEGMTETDARLKTHDDMEERGFFPKTPRLTAARVETAPEGVRVFDIPRDYFRFGMFKDIAAAIAAPGTKVKTGTGSYLKYGDDDLGPRLKAWRRAGNDSFAVRSGGAVYLLKIHRFDG